MASQPGAFEYVVGNVGLETTSMPVGADYVVGNVGLETVSQPVGAEYAVADVVYASPPTAEESEVRVSSVELIVFVPDPVNVDEVRVSSVQLLVDVEVVVPPDPDTGPSPVEVQAGSLAAVMKGIRGTELCLNGDVHFNGLTMNAFDSFGVLWLVSDIDGWWTLTPPDLPETTRGYGDGSYNTQGRYASRPLTLSGSFYAPSPSAAALARDRLLKAANLVKRGGWLRVHESIIKEAFVWLIDTPDIVAGTKQQRHDFQITLRAPDPIKYRWFGEDGLRLSTTIEVFGAQRQPGRLYERRYEWSYPPVVDTGTVSNGVFDNVGTGRIYPLLIVDGPVVGPGVIRWSNSELSGQEMVLPLTVADGDQLVIDTYNKTVNLNGVRNQRRYVEILPDWLYFDPGVTNVRFYDQGGGDSSSLTVQWRPGWI